MVDNTLIFASVAAISLFASFMLDRNKTRAALKKASKMFFGIAPSFVNILVVISISLFFIPQDLILEYIGPDSGAAGFLIAATVGSIMLIPGFVSYPIAASLISKGASYSVVAVFMTTLMMVGIVTLPLEIKYFGARTAISRNLLNFVAALIIGICVGWLMQLW
jgi:uncharacterized membrane protein YraQ (UPF0718 family)